MNLRKYFKQAHNDNRRLMREAEEAHKLMLEGAKWITEEE